MKFFTLICICASVLLLIPACNKDHASLPNSFVNLWDCHHTTSWDLSNTKNKLIGSWTWEYISCNWYPEDANDDDYKGLTISFKADNSLEVFENGKLTQTSMWHLEKVGDNIYEIESDPSVFQIYGQMLFCQNQVKFNDSILDGCDNFFSKKE